MTAMTDVLDLVASWARAEQANNAGAPNGLPAGPSPGRRTVDLGRAL
jgi:hypothetical protein